MKIADSAISMYSERTAVEVYQRREQLTVWSRGEDGENDTSRTSSTDSSDAVAGRGSENGRRVGQNRGPMAYEDLVSLSEQARKRVHREVQPEQLEKMELEGVGEEEEVMLDLNSRLLKSLFERLTGRRFQMIDPRNLQSSGGAGGEVAAGSASGENNVAAAGGENGGGESLGYGLVYDYHASSYESESTSFTASGVINTADGRQIDISLSLNMSREFYSEENFSLRMGDALKDPLVINYSGSAAELTQRDFQFDIDADGSLDQIAFVGEGSGFLALDKNGDGTINDGSELFGALSGDGFSDLAGFDEDGNGWIDEGDSVYDKLRIWTRDSGGESQLLALGQAGVGAIYLGHLETMFSLNDSSNEQLGQVRSTGLALMESGQAVTVQQLDLVA